MLYSLEKICHAEVLIVDSRDIPVARAFKGGNYEWYIMDAPGEKYLGKAHRKGDVLPSFLLWEKVKAITD